MQVIYRILYILSWPLRFDWNAWIFDDTRSELKGGMRLVLCLAVIIGIAVGIFALIANYPMIGLPPVGILVLAFIVWVIMPDRPRNRNS